MLSSAPSAGLIGGNVHGGGGGGGYASSPALAPLSSGGVGIGGGAGGGANGYSMVADRSLSPLIPPHSDLALQERMDAHAHAHTYQ